MSTTRAPRPIKHATDRECEARSNKGRPEIDFSPHDAIQVEVGEDMLGNKAESLRAGGQRAHHRRSRDEHNPPSIVRTPDHGSNDTPIERTQSASGPRSGPGRG